MIDDHLHAPRAQGVDDAVIAIMLTYVLSGRPWQYRLLELGYIPKPTPDQVRLFTFLGCWR